LLEKEQKLVLVIFIFIVVVTSEDLYLPDLLLFYSSFSKLVFEIHARNGKDSVVCVLQLALDYHDMMKMPILNDYIRGAKSKVINILLISYAMIVHCS
jgi:hypothetical protein